MSARTIVVSLTLHSDFRIAMAGKQSID
jgi:hypothetical protein